MLLGAVHWVRNGWQRKGKSSLRRGWMVSQADECQLTLVSVNQHWALINMALVCFSNCNQVGKLSLSVAKWGTSLGMGWKCRQADHISQYNQGNFGRFLSLRVQTYSPALSRSILPEGVRNGNVQKKQVPFSHNWSQALVCLSDSEYKQASNIWPSPSSVPRGTNIWLGFLC